MHRFLMLLATLAVVLAAVACARDLGASPEPSRPTRTAPDLPSVPASEDAGIGEVPSDILDRVVADAAERTGAAADAIDLVTAVAVTFNDGSLDCPEPGMLYTQALVDGYRVVLDADGTELDYRVTADGGFRLCEEPGRPAG
jgi:hypothetical protein